MGLCCHPYCTHSTSKQIYIVCDSVIKTVIYVTGEAYLHSNVLYFSPPSHSHPLSLVPQLQQVRVALLWVEVWVVQPPPPPPLLWAWACHYSHKNLLGGSPLTLLPQVGTHTPHTRFYDCLSLYLCRPASCLLFLSPTHKEMHRHHIDVGDYCSYGVVLLFRYGCCCTH